MYNPSLHVRYGLRSVVWLVFHLPFIPIDWYAALARFVIHHSPPFFLCLVGAPGVGKGDLVKAFEFWIKDFSRDLLVKISMSDALSDLWKSGLVEAVIADQECQKMKSGTGLVNDVFVEMALGLKLKALSEGNQCVPRILVLDGFPRTIQQFDALNGFAVTHERGLAALHLDAPVEYLVDRMMKRGRGDSSTEGQCTARIETDKRKCKPAVQFLRRHARRQFYAVDARGTREEVFGKALYALCMIATSPMRIPEPIRQSNACMAGESSPATA